MADAAASLMALPRQYFFAKGTMNKIVSLRLAEEEKKEIDRKADACCPTHSQYIRQTALGIVPRSKFDHQHVYALAKLNGDVGRVGGLTNRGRYYSLFLNIFL